MTNQKRILNVGALPEQTDDYGRFEESSVRWDRLAVALMAIVLVTFVIYTLFGSDKSTDLPPLNVNEKVNSPLPENTSKIDKPLTDKPKNISDVKTESRPVKTAPSIPQNIIPDTQVRKKEVLPKKNPIQVLNSGIIQAQLSSSLNADGLPIDKLASTIEMSEEKIIKVVLFTEMEGMRGKDLYHDWYRNNNRQARVKIPVNRTLQQSSSSKYINHQMLGQWQVKVLDSEDNLYIQAEFEVTSK